MQVKLISSSVDGQSGRHYLTSYRINDTLLIDAGGAGLDGSPEEQARIRFVLISHAHADHIASLPILIENAYEEGREGPTILGAQASLDSLRKHVFNDEIWPDLVRLGSGSQQFLRFVPLEPGVTIELEGLRITPILVDHVIPTLGFVVAQDGVSVIIVSDTGPTEAIWDVANATADLRAVFLEASFPDEMAGLAEITKHLTPATFAREVAKLKTRTRIIAVHFKERFRLRIVDELKALGIPNLEVGVPGTEYHFS